MSLNLEAADILLAARDEVMKPGGWCQGSYGDYAEPEGPVCAYGALARVGMADPCYLDNGWGLITPPNGEPLIMAVVAAVDQTDLPLSVFNDRAESASEVADLFDRAATHLKGLA